MNNIIETHDIRSRLSVLYCHSNEFLDKLEELYIGQVLIVTRYSKENHDIISEAWIREGNTIYRKLNGLDISASTNNIGDKNNVIIREE